jgi:putative phosphoesterase
MSTPNRLARIGIIGDIHAEYKHLCTALSFLDKLSLQAILCVGDIVDGPESVDQCCELIQQHQAFTVRGNHDQWFLSNQMRSLPEATLSAHVSNRTQAFLQSLPLVQEFQTNQGRLLLCHGIGKEDMGRITPDDYGYSLEMNFELREIVSAKQYRFMVSGHTHQKMVRTFGGLTVINPGSLVHLHAPGFLTADFELGLVQSFALTDFAGVEKMEEIAFSAVKSENLNPPPFY